MYAFRGWQQTGSESTLNILGNSIPFCRSDILPFCSDIFITLTQECVIAQCRIRLYARHKKLVNCFRQENTYRTSPARHVRVPFSSLEQTLCILNRTSLYHREVRRSFPMMQKTVYPLCQVNGLELAVARRAEINLIRKRRSVYTTNKTSPAKPIVRHSQINYS